MFDIKSPAEWMTDKIKMGATDLVISYIESLPILLGVSIGVYALLGMFSKSLAKFGVVSVFIYGGFVVIL